jgi:hypothetical protein
MLFLRRFLPENFVCPYKVNECEEVEGLLNKVFKIFSEKRFSKNQFESHNFDDNLP